MRIAATDELRAHVAGHGGVIYVRTRSARCCSGPLIVLDASTVPPADVEGYRDFDGGDFRLMFRSLARPDPDELVLTLEGRRRPRPCAYWDGSALVL